jgi:hypothetical protein
MTRRLSFAVCGALLAALLSAPAAAAEATDPRPAALRHARDLQDTARGLRNGATAGAGAQVLASEAGRLRASLAGLVESHKAWADTLEDSRRGEVASELSEIDQGCDRIAQALIELDDVLAATGLDRAHVQRLGRSIGRQARLCARALDRASRR